MHLDTVTVRKRMGVVALAVPANLVQRAPRLGTADATTVAVSRCSPRETGRPPAEVCPANWTPGSKAMHADLVKSREYFETVKNHKGWVSDS